MRARRTSVLGALALVASSPAVVAAAQPSPPTLTTFAPKSVDNLGGVVSIDLHGAGATTCTVSSVHWVSQPFSKMVFCPRGVHSVAVPITVPANTTTVPVAMIVKVAARAGSRETVKYVQVVVDAAPAPPQPGTEEGADAPSTRHSTNWSGYVLNAPKSTPAAPGFRAVAGTWRAPRFTCSPLETAWSGIWVGVDGRSRTTNDIFQTGINAECIEGVVVERAWWTDQAHNFEPQILFPVNAGDSIQAEVLFHARGQWSYYIADKTTGKAREHTVPYAGPGATAEWILEGTPHRPLPSFGSVKFTNLGLTPATGTWSAPWRSKSENIVSSGATETSTGRFLGSGAAAAFSVFVLGTP